MFSIVKNWKIFFAITVSFLVIGIGSILFKGFNLGIDFTGGSIMDLSFNKAVTVSEVRDVLKEHNLGTQTKRKYKQFCESFGRSTHHQESPGGPAVRTQHIFSLL